MARKRGSSGRWLKEHRTDAYVKRARSEGYRSRAVYKLEQIHKRDRILKPGRVVVDLGAAPGGWSQYAARQVGPKGRVLALDVQDMPPLEGVEFLQGDFRENEGLTALEQALGDSRVDLVLSDMAPNLSGISVADQARAMELAELALDFAKKHLQGGDMLVKVFQGEGFDAFLADARQTFRRVMIRKPEASRDRSRELYLLALDHRL